MCTGYLRCIQLNPDMSSLVTLADVSIIYLFLSPLRQRVIGAVAGGCSAIFGLAAALAVWWFEHESVTPDVKLVPKGQARSPILCLVAVCVCVYAPRFPTQTSFIRRHSARHPELSDVLC